MSKPDITIKFSKDIAFSHMKEFLHLIAKFSMCYTATIKVKKTRFKKDEG